TWHHSMLRKASDPLSGSNIVPASSNLEALRSAFDSDGDGKLTSADADFAKFKLLVTKAEGTTEVKTLAQLNITEIEKASDSSHVELPDGSLMTGQTSFLRGTERLRSFTRRAENLPETQSR
ncbi:MAG: hypothetical protein AAGA70_16395, partial [Pseudomonadota bacterium]